MQATFTRLALQHLNNFLKQNVGTDAITIVKEYITRITWIVTHCSADFTEECVETYLKLLIVLLQFTNHLSRINTEYMTSMILQDPKQISIQNKSAPCLLLYHTEFREHLSTGMRIKPLMTDRKISLF